MGAASIFYADVLSRLNTGEIPYLVGGGFAYTRYSGVERTKKDLDLFVRPSDAPRVLERLAAAGFETEMTFPHWLGKVKLDNHLIDVIFSSGNGIARVDDLWFRHCVPDQVVGIPVRLCPPEEMIWSKAFVQERERFDGADVLHMFRALGPDLDWPRLLMRFDRHWRVLFSSIVMFGYAYPADLERIPSWVTEELTQRFITDRADPTSAVCQGTLLSRSQYHWDVEQLGQLDARVRPFGPLTRAEVAIWDAGAEEDH